MSKYMNRQYTKAYRKRLLEKKRELEPRKVPLTAAERMRNWRKRCKEAASRMNADVGTPKDSTAVLGQSDTVESGEKSVSSKDDPNLSTSDLKIKIEQAIDQ